MALTPAEDKRLRDIEQSLNNMLTSLDGVGSKNQLNRLHIILSRELDRLEAFADSLETNTSKVLELARKVQ